VSSEFKGVNKAIGDSLSTAPQGRPFTAMPFAALLFRGRATGVGRTGLEQQMLRRSMAVWGGRGGSRIDDSECDPLKSMQQYAKSKNPAKKFSMASRIREHWYPTGVIWDLPLPPAAPLESLLETTAQRLPEAIAIDFYDRVFTYRELQQLVARAAKGLQPLDETQIVPHLRFDPEGGTCRYLLQEDHAGSRCPGHVHGADQSSEVRSV